eukprot:652376-Rhodomonas_salina.12
MSKPDTAHHTDGDRRVMLPAAFFMAPCKHRHRSGSSIEHYRTWNSRPARRHPKNISQHRTWHRRPVLVFLPRYQTRHSRHEDRYPNVTTLMLTPLMLRCPISCLATSNA